MSQMHKLVVDLRTRDCAQWKVDLTYYDANGSHELGEYEIQCVYPNTIQIIRPGGHHSIWIPNPVNTPSIIEYSGDDKSKCPIFRVLLLEDGRTVYKVMFSVKS